MLHKTKLLLAAALALVAIAALGGTASAGTVDIDPGGAVDAISDGKVIFDSSLADVECNLTLDNVFDAGPVNNASGTKIGDVDSVEIANCEGADSVNVLGNPWSMNLTAAVTSTLASFTVTGASFEMVNVFGGLDCLYRGNSNATSPISSGEITSVSSSANALNRAAGQSIFCPASGRLVGDFEIEPDQTVTLIP